MIGLGGNTAGTLDAFAWVRGRLTILLEGARFSSLYRTIPQDDADQDDFWNAAVAGQWEGTAAGLLERLLMMEAAAGRVRDAMRPKGPRVLDIDLLVFGEQVVDTPRLAVPHPRLAVRRFALAPLVELLPDAVDSRTGRKWAVELAGLDAQGVDRTDQTW